MLEKYGYSSYVSGISPDDDNIAFALLAFVCDHFGHNGSRGLGPDRDIAGVIAFCEEHDMRTNCRGLALLLASLLRKNGIKARHITCLPFEEPFNDCHVVVDCLLPSGQRIMLDPTQRLYYTDKNGAYVSLEKLRTMLINGETPVHNADASYNGGAFSADDNIEYMTKNTLRFSRGKRYADGTDIENSELIPAEYPTDAFPESRRHIFTHNAELFWRM